MCGANAPNLHPVSPDFVRCQKARIVDRRLKQPIPHQEAMMRAKRSQYDQDLELGARYYRSHCVVNNEWANSPGGLE